MQTRKNYFFLLLTFAILFSAKAKAAGTDPYKGNDQLIVFDSTFVQMTESGLCYTTQHIRYKAFTTQGAKNFSTIKYDYEPLSADVQIISAKIMKADKSTIELDASKVYDYEAPARAIYWGARQKMLAVGRIESGDMIDIVLSRKGFTYALLQQNDEERFIPPMRGEFYEIIHFFGSMPMQTKYYEVNIPADKTVQYKLYNGDFKVLEENTDKMKTFKFSKTQIMPFKSEANMVGLVDVAPKVIITTTMKWEEKSKWFYGVNEDYGSFSCTPELQTLVDELLVGSKTELDSIHALTHWIADNMRYSGLTMGSGEGYTLHNVDMNLTDRCGVCKDKASLLVAMLRAAGFESYAAMTMAGSRIENIPADQFNHSVTAVIMRDGKLQMLDPTWVPFNRELWSSLEQQQNFLVGTAEGMTLMETPISDPINHYLYIDNKAKIDKDGNLVGTFTIDAEGQSDAAVRGLMTGPKYRRAQALEKMLRKYHPNIIVNSYEGIDNPYTYFEPVHLIINYQIPSFAEITDKEILFNPPLTSGFFKDLFWHLSLDNSIESRDYAFKTRCTQLIKETETIELPSYVKSLYAPKNPKEITGSSASYKADYSLSDSKYTFKNEVSINKRIFDKEEWSNVRSVVAEHKKTLDESIILEK